MRHSPKLFPLMAALLLPATAASAQNGAAGLDPATARASLPPPALVHGCESPAGSEEILVCGNRNERSPYRLPPAREGFDPNGPVPSVSRERHALYELGGTGIGSCSNVGPGGYTGCDFMRWKAEFEQRAAIKKEEGAFIDLGPFKYRVGR